MFVFDFYFYVFQFAFATKGRVIISFIFYSSLPLNSALFMLLLANATTALTGMGPSISLAISTLMYIVVANVCTVNSSPVIRCISIVGTFATVSLLLLLVFAEILALVRMHGIGQLYDRTEEGPHTSRNTGSLFGQTERVYWTDFKACLKTLGIFG